jgi:hypothetical protein
VMNRKKLERSRYISGDNYGVRLQELRKNLVQAAYAPAEVQRTEYKSVA